MANKKQELSIFVFVGHRDKAFAKILSLGQNLVSGAYFSILGRIFH